MQHELAALDMIEQPARRRDQDVGAAIDLGVLLVEGHAADQQGDRQPVVAAEALERFLNLARELAGRFEHQRARHAGARPSLFEQRQHRQGKSAVLPEPVSRRGPERRGGPGLAEWLWTGWEWESRSRQPERRRELFRIEPN